MREENGWRGELASGVLHLRGLDFWRLFPDAWTPPVENTGRKLEGKRKEEPRQAAPLTATISLQLFPLQPARPFLCGSSWVPPSSPASPRHNSTSSPILFRPGTSVPFCCCRIWGCHAIPSGFSSVSSLRQTVPYIKSPLFERTR